MPTLIQKVFLPKNKLQALYTIEQNVDAIEFRFAPRDQYSKYALCKITISTPTVFLCAMQEINLATQKQTSSFTFQQFASNGNILSMTDGNKTKFADLVFNKILSAYTANTHSNKKVR